MYYVWREALKQKFDCFKNCWLVAITTSYQRESYVSPAPSALYEWYIRDGMHGMAIVDALRTLHVCGRKCTMYARYAWQLWMRYVRYMCADENEGTCRIHHPLDQQIRTVRIEKNTTRKK